MESIVISQELATRYGLAEAALLSLVHRECICNGEGIDWQLWIGMSYPDWHRKYRFLGSEKTIQRLFSALESLDLIQSRQLDGVDRTKRYRVSEQIFQILK